MIIIPGHRTHEVVGVTLTPLVFAGAFTYNVDIAVGITAFYVIATFYFSPDLDIDSAPYYRWQMFSFIWWPYKVLIKHRSLLSHSGPLSATIRFVYFMSFVVLLAYVFSFSLLTYLPYCGMLWVGIILADSIHTTLDLIWKD